MAEHGLNSTTTDARHEEEAERREKRNQWLTEGTPGSGTEGGEQGGNYEPRVGRER